jgi:hypothetical protein
MFRFAGFVRTIACVVALAACSGDAVTETALDQAGNVQLRLSNTGSVTMTTVSVLVAEGAAPITVDELRPGQTLARVGRAVVHQNPYVTAKADGQSLVSHPVEGFAGFNPTLSDGSYTVRLEVVPGENGGRRLDVRVVRDP